MSEFNLHQTNQGEVHILSLTGYMGNADVCQVENVLGQLRAQNQDQVILDLTKLSFTTSVSLARFRVRGREFRRMGGQLKLAGLSPELTRFAEWAGLSAQNALAPDVAAALKVMAPTPKRKRPSPNRK